MQQRIQQHLLVWVLQGMLVQHLALVLSVVAEIAEKGILHTHAPAACMSPSTVGTENRGPANRS